MYQLFMCILCADMPFTSPITCTQQLHNIILIFIIGFLCGKCQHEDKGFSALFNKCVSCGYTNILLVVALSELPCVCVQPHNIMQLHSIHSQLQLATVAICRRFTYTLSHSAVIVNKLTVYKQLSLCKLLHLYTYTVISINTSTYCCLHHISFITAALLFVCTLIQIIQLKLKYLSRTTSAAK